MKYVIDFSLESDMKKLNEIIETRKPKKYIVEIKEAREPRSFQQHKYYAVVIGIIAGETGNDWKVIHNFYKERLLGFEENVMPNSGTVIKSVRSTKDNDTLEMTIYIDQIRTLALQEEDIYCPTPEEYLKNQIELNTKYLNE